jgi:hypothetical protein
MIWIADAHRGDEKRFVVHADEKLTAFLELESAIRASGAFEKRFGANPCSYLRNFDPNLIMTSSPSLIEGDC